MPTKKLKTKQTKKPIHKRWMKVQFFTGLVLNLSLLLGLYILVTNYIESNTAAQRKGLIPQHLKPLFLTMAPKKNLPPELVAAVAYQESKFNPTVCSGEGACGLMQFMPGTAKRFGVNVWDEASSIRGAVEYLAILRRMFNGNIGLALAAYNWGEGNVQKWLKNGADPKTMPDETRKYVRLITGVDIRVWTGQVQDAEGIMKYVAIDTVEHTSLLRPELQQVPRIIKGPGV